MLKPSSLFFPHVNLLRAFAALSVLVYHVIEHFPWTAFPITGPLLWFRIGWMGVDLFFVISGFVIMLSALQLSAADKPTARKRFIIRRLARIIPLYLLTGAAYLFLISPELIHAPDFLRHLITHLTFTHNLWADTHGSINGPNWSVAAEMQFYIFILLFMPILCRARPLNILLFGLALSWSLRLGLFIYADGLDWSVPRRFVKFTQMPMMMDLFALGMALAKYLFDQKRNTPPAFVGMIAAAIILTIALTIYWQHAEFWHNLPMVVFWRSLMGLGFACLLYAFILLPAKGTKGSESDPLEGELARTRKRGQFLAPVKIGGYLGEISYGIYLWHLPVILLLKRTDISNPPSFLCITILLVLLLSALSWHAIEKPLINVAKTRTKAP